MININIPFGGFLATGGTNKALSNKTNLLKNAGADVYTDEESGIVLASFQEFDGQGVFSSGNEIMVYDLNLTNFENLKHLLEDRSIANQGELICGLYHQFGIDFLDKLRGSFAFALWDRKNRKLLAATDFFGICPVVYLTDSSQWAIASRIKHLLLLPWVSHDMNPEAIYHYLFFSAIPSPVSIYKNIKKLEPGKGLMFEKGSVKEFTHYDIQYKPDISLPESNWIRAIPAEVEKAVAEYVKISNPEKTGCFLSGGTDSSSIAGYYTNLSGRPAKTFSIGFDDPKYNELGYAHIAANHFGTEQHDYYVTPKDVIQLIEILPEIYDEPFGNSSVVPAYYCAKLARESGVEVLLGGDGGDEIFGGNERYVTNLVFELYSTIPEILRSRILEPIIKRLPDFTPIFMAKRYIRRANIPNPGRFFSYNLLAETDAQSIFQPDFLAQIDTGCFLNLAKSLFQRVAPAHVTDRLLYIDMKFTITDNDLHKVTQMVESAGLRVRYPLLDRDLVDFTATIPPTFKVKRGKNRYIFKQAMEGFLPQEIIKKKKHGMGLPIASWFKKDSTLAASLYDTLFSSAPRITKYVRPQFLSKMKSAFEADTTSYYGSNLWVFLMLELWLKNRKL